MRRRFFLLFNPGAGTSKQTRCTAVCNRLIAAGASVESIIAKSAEQARAMAREAALSGHYDAIVAAGGDGTVRQAAAAVIGTKCPVGAIMLGTGTGSEVMRRIAAPMVGGMVSSTVLTLLVIPAAFLLWKRRGLSQG